MKQERKGERNKRNGERIKPAEKKEGNDETEELRKK